MRALFVGNVVIGAACGRMSFDEYPRDAAAGAVADADADAMATDALDPDAFVAPAPGCKSPELPGPYSTNFDQGVPPWGSIYQLGAAQMDVFQGQLRGRPAMDPGMTVYAGFQAGIADYRERRVFVEIPTMVNTASCAQVSFNIQDDDATRYAEFTQECGMLEAFLWVGSTPTTLATTSYNPTMHRWWQLRAQAGTLYFEVSSDGITWMPFASTPTPAYFNDVYLELATGTYQMESMTLGESRFDNLFDCFP
jgi:hypothetical protein